MQLQMEQWRRSAEELNRQMQQLRTELPRSVNEGVETSRGAPSAARHPQVLEVLSRTRPNKEPSSSARSEANQLDELRRELETLRRRVEEGPAGPSEIDRILGFDPFSAEIHAEPPPPKVKGARLDDYDGTTDPAEHLMHFTSAVYGSSLSDAAHCRLFSTTLKGAARTWFTSQRMGSIYSFHQFSTLFLNAFAYQRKEKKETGALFRVKQGSQETLRSFLRRFNMELREIADVDENLAMTALKENVRDYNLMVDIHRNPPKDFRELLTRAQMFAKAEAEFRSRTQPDLQAPPRGKKERVRGDPGGSRSPEAKRPRWDEERVRLRPKYDAYTPLNASRKEILMQIEQKDFVKWPGKMQAPLEMRDRTKYCYFHRDHGHDTEDRIRLQDEIESLIRRGFLKAVIRQDRASQCPPRRRSPENKGRRASVPQRDKRKEPEEDRSTKEKTLTPAGEIHVIAGGLAGGGLTQSSRTRHAREARRRPTEAGQCSTPVSISFSDHDYQGVHRPHDDPLVITAMIANYRVHRLLIDTGSSADILTEDAFRQLGLGRDHLKPFPHSLVGFTGDLARPEGTITLPVRLEGGGVRKTVMADFLVVPVNIVYNAILG